MATLVEHEHDWVQRILGEELRPADDHSYEANRIKQIRSDRKACSRSREGANGGYGQTGKAHRQTACNSREGKFLVRSPKFLSGVVDSSLEDFRRGESACIRSAVFVLHVLDRCQSFPPQSCRQTRMPMQKT